VVVSSAGLVVTPSLAATGDVTTVAGGGGSLGDGGPATAGTLNRPIRVVGDSTGTFYIADTDNNRVRKVDPTGHITTVAGTGSAGFSGDGGPATAATLRQPNGLALDTAGNLFVSDSGNSRVRKVAPNGVITTVAGNGTPAVPGGMAVDAAGNLFVAHVDDHRVRKVAPNGVVTIVAGNGSAGFSGDGGPATAASLMAPEDVALDAAGNLFVADTGNSRVRRVGTNGVITTVAGNGVSGFSGDGGPATAATLSLPLGVTVDPSGNLFVADSANNRVRKVNTAGVITTVAGDGTASFSGDGGSATAAGFRTPAGVAVAPRGDLLIADVGNNRIRRVEGITGTPLPPSPPTLTSTAPPSPANANAPLLLGTAPAGTTVSIHTDSSCASAVLATGTAATFASTGIPVAVGNDTATTFWATATDANGTSACSSSSVTYTEDSTAPAPPDITQSPPAVGRDTALTWRFSGGAGSSFLCDLTRSGVTVASGPCASPAAFDLSGQPDGVYTFSVRAVDPAGNPSQAATGTYTLDRTAPAPPTFTAAPSDGTDASPTWSFEAEVSASFECRLVRGSTIVADAPCSSPVTYDLSSGPDGTYTLNARAIDAAGNASAWESDSYSLDRVPPSGPTITAEPPATGSDPGPAWSFASEPGATFECELTRGGLVVVANAACSSPIAYDLTGQPDATYTFAVRSIDPFGNAGEVVTDDYTLDRVAPATPTFTAEPLATGSDRSPSWSFSGDGDATFDCALRRGGILVAASAACASPTTYDLSGQPDGTYTIAVRSTDAAGNTSALVTGTYALDTAAPDVPTFTATPGATGSDPSPSWRFSGDAGATFRCELTRGGVVVAADPCASPAGYDLSSRPDGPYTLSVRAVDDAGNTSAAATDDYTLDTAAPSVPAFTATPGVSGSDPMPSWSFSADVDASLECELTRGGVVVAGEPCASLAAYDLSSEPDGTYTLTVRAVDDAGNTSAAATDDYMLDRVAPSDPAFSATPGPTGSDPSPSWSFSGDAGATFQCELTRGGVVVAAGSCASPAPYDLSSEPDGTYTLTVRAVDEAGNTSTAATDDYALDTAAPSVPVFTATPGSLGSDPSPSWSFSGDGDATFRCKLTRGGVMVAADPCSSPAGYDLSSQPDGPYTLSVRAVDVAGNTSAAATDDYTLDRAVPPSEPAIPADPPPSPASEQPPSAPPDTSPSAPSSPAAPVPTTVEGTADPVEPSGPAGARPSSPAPASEADAEVRSAIESGPDRRPEALLVERASDHGDDGGLLPVAMVRTLEKAVFPVLLLLVMAAFLAAQNRIDRADPKLAAAPIRSEPLTFN